MRSVLAVIVVLTGGMFSAPVSAQDTPANRTDYISGPYYDSMARQALERPANFEFGPLRSYYTQTAHYDPLGDKTRQEMLGLAYKMQNENDAGKREAAAADYQNLVLQHLAHIDMITQALALAREDQIYGDPAFFEWVRAGLIKDLLGSGDGTSLHRAYDVVTLAEEEILIRQLRLRLLKTESAEQGGVYYSMYQVEDGPGREPYWIFINTTQPMAFLEDQKRRQGKSFTLRQE